MHWFRLPRYPLIALLAAVAWGCGAGLPSPSAAGLPAGSPTSSPIQSAFGATGSPGASGTASVPGSPAGSPGSSVASPAASIATPPTSRVSGATVSIAAAGDIACDPASNTGAPALCDQAATATLIGALHPNAVLPLGDNQYEKGSLAAYQSVFNATWGRFKSIMFPAIGNHEYLTPGAAGYFGYFGNIAPYYSWQLGAWHMISLDSECSFVGGCGAGSRQESWLRSDLAAHQGQCILAYWHEPRWSSGQLGDATQMAVIWNDLVAAHASVVLSGHNHDYEHFVPLNAAGQPDPAGVAEFVAGTGGRNPTPWSTGPLSGEVSRNNTSFGVLYMTLRPGSYSWRFVPAPGFSFTDSGSANCS